MDYTTPTNYTFKHLPSGELTEEQKEILEASTMYPFLKVLLIHNHLWVHIRNTFNIIEANDSNVYHYIFQDCMGQIAAFLKSFDNDFVHIVIDTANPMGLAFFEHLNKFNQHSDWGLEKLIDPNYGGRFNYERMAYISLIHFG